MTARSATRSATRGHDSPIVAAEVAGLKLEAAEAEVLAADAADFAGALRDGDARPATCGWRRPRPVVRVPDDLLPALETMLELLFEKGRPSNRAVLQAVFARTPRGRQHSAAAREVNTALRALRGQKLEDLRLDRGPSATPWSSRLTVPPEPGARRRRRPRRQPRNRRVQPPPVR